MTESSWRSCCVGLLSFAVMLCASLAEAAHVTNVTIQGPLTAGSTLYKTVTIVAAPDFVGEDWFNPCNCGITSVFVWITASVPSGNLCVASTPGGLCSVVDPTYGSGGYYIPDGQTSVTFYVSANGLVNAPISVDVTAGAGNTNYPGARDAGIVTSATVQPGITSSSNTVWWFGGQSPSNYTTSVQLSTADGSSAMWAVDSGASKVNISFTQGTQTTVTSSGTSFSAAPNDVVIGISDPNTQTWAQIALTSRTPNSLLPGQSATTCDPAWGYATTLTYTVLDQLGVALPQGVPVNEQWTTSVVNDYSGTNWRRGAAGSLNSSSAMFADLIQGETSNKRPKPTCDPASTIGVEHWGQAWRIGSLTSGAGKRVQTNVLQKNVGRALHTSILSPPL